MHIINLQTFGVFDIFLQNQRATVNFKTNAALGMVRIVLCPIQFFDSVLKGISGEETIKKKKPFNVTKIK